MHLTPEEAAALRKLGENMPAIEAALETKQRVLSEDLKPAIDSLLAARESLTAISSDIFNTYALARTNLDLVASQLLARVDFEALSRAITGFGEQQAKIWQYASEAFARIPGYVFVSNLRDIKDITNELLEVVVMVDGISLYEVPRTEIATEIIFADNASQRRAVLKDRWREIVIDCREVIARHSHDETRELTETAAAALDALNSGNHKAAQALTASLIDATLRKRLKGKRHNYMPSKSGNRTRAAFDELNVRTFIAFAPIWQTYQHYDPDKGDPIPTTFSRHATAHTVSSDQYTLANTMQGVMVAVGLLCHFNERIAAEDS
ncbi:hypothetical protein R4144_00770 [Gordonia amicalis]|uniref:hypothetical protein n=1 Tax=Gordonia amicalis TaxID=89053 RepID=UPI002954A7AF|nr:hypothetical protein [Gordonia amicalis]MDV7171949.1 hypothetical protein [Gordonia amicalis]